jgi:hypothetical protein
MGDVIHSISEVARPGTKVVFLIPYVTDDLTVFAAHWSTMETGMYSAIRLAKALEKESRERQDVDVKVKEKVLASCEAVRRSGLELSVDLYAGSLRTAMERYTRNGEGLFVIAPVPMNFEAMWFRFRRIVSGLFKRPRFATLVHGRL